MAIITAEQDLYKTCKDSLQWRYMESTDPDAKVYPETYIKAMNVLNNTKRDKRPSNQVQHKQRRSPSRMKRFDLLCRPQTHLDALSVANWNEKVHQGIDIHTNTGMQAINRQAPLSNIGKVWFDDKMMSNVLSQAKLADDPNFDVDCVKKTKDGGDYFTLKHSPTNKTIKFTRIGDHYAYKPKLAAVGLVQTVEENKKFYTKAQVDQADKARTLMKTLMMSTVKTLKQAILTNQIQNCPVTDKDCDIAIQIYGKDIASLKGKLTKSKATPAVDDVVAIPRDYSTSTRMYTYSLISCMSMDYYS